MRIQQLVAETSRAAFLQDWVLQSAIAYQLQVVGEAASRLSSPVRLAHPDIPWRSIIGMRNIIVHDDARLDATIIWRTASERVPELIRALAHEFPSEPP